MMPVVPSVAQDGKRRMMVDSAAAWAQGAVRATSATEFTVQCDELGHSPGGQCHDESVKHTSAGSSTCGLRFGARFAKFTLVWFRTNNMNLNLQACSVTPNTLIPGHTLLTFKGQTPEIASSWVHKVRRARHVTTRSCIRMSSD